MLAHSTFTCFIDIKHKKTIIVHLPIIDYVLPMEMEMEGEREREKVVKFHASRKYSFGKGNRKTVFGLKASKSGRLALNSLAI